MRAVDTNILVRLVARDDARQLEAAIAIIEAGDILLLPTVLLEAEWVLRSSYRLPRRQIAEGLSAICAQDGVTVVSAGAAARALAIYAERGDFADLLHFALAAEIEAEAFITFDRRFTPAGDYPLVERA